MLKVWCKETVITSFNIPPFPYNCSCKFSDKEGGGSGGKRLWWARYYKMTMDVLELSSSSNSAKD
jgi:hypothetical protein